MKFRNGFVSNSSSSSFIVCIPPDFGQNDFNKLVSMNKLKTEYKNKYNDTIFQNYVADNMDEQKHIQRTLKEAFKLLKNNDKVHQMDTYTKKNGTEEWISNIGIEIAHVLESKDMVLMELGVSTSSGSVTNICTSKNIKKFQKLL